jgi:hypothetical protein
MCLDVVGNHFRRDKQQVALRNSKVSARPTLTAQFAVVPTTANGPTKGVDAVAPGASEGLKSAKELRRHVPHREGMLG